MRFLFSLGLPLLILASAAHAQQMYRCGSTFSQVPCDADAKPARMSRAAAPDRAPGLSGIDLCAAEGKKLLNSPEPESARVQAVGAPVSEVIKYAGQSLAARRIDLTIDAKNLSGMYAGPVGFTCWLSEDQARVLQFGRSRAR